MSRFLKCAPRANDSLALVKECECAEADEGLCSRSLSEIVKKLNMVSRQTGAIFSHARVQLRKFVALFAEGSEGQKVVILS